MQLVRNVLSLLILTPTVLFLMGCGGGGQGDISGEVSYGGKPLAAGRVTFLSMVGDKKVLSAPIRRGKYEIKGCPAGPVKIGVESFRPRKKSTEVPKGITKGFTPAPDDDPEPNAPPLPFVPIPQHFASPESSGLDYTVTRGTQVHPLLLKP